MKVWERIYGYFDGVPEEFTTNEALAYSMSIVLQEIGSREAREHERRFKRICERCRLLHGANRLGGVERAVKHIDPAERRRILEAAVRALKVIQEVTKEG